MKILITGGAGMIGQHLVRKLGDDLTIYDTFRRSAVTAESLRGVCSVIEGDILDEELLEASMQSVDVVVHLAAYGSVIESISDPEDNFTVNARGTLNVLSAARKAGVKKVVFSSTGGAIMGDTSPPVNEKSLPAPISPYGASKLCGEAYMSAFAAAYDMSCISLRFANVYGRWSSHKKGAVTKFIKSCLLGDDITIFGDGLASRDFMHADDLCDGIVAAVNNCELRGHNVFHLASGNEVSVRDLAHLITELSDAPSTKLNYLGARKGEVVRNFADATLAANILGFAPAIDLRTGLADCIQWFKSLDKDVLLAEEFDS